ncbi:LIM domain-containing protein WLIM2b-like [Canna indica]|uniref:LIM domain-containing protein WLIM2b-like n=1 Tax=Canna indica TaxID=4628 RepID=A0AAQ3KJL1_9LILI|nr:LIM domain-containing protein WLIM2b-like [Canna indica]
MSFSGTQDKCKACDKTVHFIDLLTADGATFHKTCFKCSRCKGLLSMCNYSSMDGVLYCKHHFEQLFKETGKYPSSGLNHIYSLNYISHTLAILIIYKIIRSSSKFSQMFTGTQDKCANCKKTAYPLEKLTVEGEIYHKTCFKCSHGGCTLTPSSYAALDGILYCRHHFAQLFMEKGSYSHLVRVASMKKNAQEQQAAPPAEESTAAEGKKDQEES